MHEAAGAQSEDEVVFPALEGKEGLVNVSQAYTLDHQAEAQLFQDLDQVLCPSLLALSQHAQAWRARRACAHSRAARSHRSWRPVCPCSCFSTRCSMVHSSAAARASTRFGGVPGHDCTPVTAPARQVFTQLKGCQGLHALRQVTGQLQRNCAAMRATLEQHVRAEEQELWPLFAEHFTTAEQEEVVGRIIGRTGAEALQAMLPWVAGGPPAVPCCTARCGCSPVPARTPGSCGCSWPSARVLLGQRYLGSATGAVQSQHLRAGLPMALVRLPSTAAQEQRCTDTRLVVAAGAFTEEEQRNMMDSLRSASRNTMFDSWLESAMAGGLAGAPGSAPTLQVRRGAPLSWLRMRTILSHRALSADSSI